MKQFLVRVWDYIKFLWEKYFSKNYCEICHNKIEYESAAMCMVHPDGNMYICDQCVESAWRQTMDPVIIESDFDVK